MNALVHDGAGVHKVRFLDVGNEKEKKLDRSPAFPTSEDFIYDHKI